MPMPVHGTFSIGWKVATGVVDAGMKAKVVNLCVAPVMGPVVVSADGVALQSKGRAAKAAAPVDTC
jgi:hypothetical protein